MRTVPTTHGHTLIEVVIYVALLGLLLTGAITAAFSLVSGSEHNMRALEIRKEALFLQEKIDWALSNAKRVSVSADGGKIVIHRMSGENFLDEENPVTFFLEDDALVMQRGSAAPIALNAKRIPISTFEALVEPRGVYQSINIAVRIDEHTFTFHYSIEL